MARRFSYFLFILCNKTNHTYVSSFFYFFCPSDMTRNQKKDGYRYMYSSAASWSWLFKKLLHSFLFQRTYFTLHFLSQKNPPGHVTLFFPDPALKTYVPFLRSRIFSSFSCISTRKYIEDSFV